MRRPLVQYLGLLAAMTQVIGLASSTPAYAQAGGDPLVNVGGPHVDLGLPATNALEGHPEYLAPGVGKVVAMAKYGFRTPDFSYSFMHPLASYTHPLAPPGQFGTYMGPSSPGQSTHTIVHHFGPYTGPASPGGSPQLPPANIHAPQTFLANPWHGGSQTIPQRAAPYKGPALYGAGDDSQGQAAGDEKSSEFFVDPWQEATYHAVLWPHLGFFGHYGEVNDHHGMLVTAVALKSIAHHIGLIPGDVITSVGGKEIDNPHTYMKAIRDAKGDVPVEVWHSATHRDATLTLNFDKLEASSSK